MNPKLQWFAFAYESSGDSIYICCFYGTLDDVNGVTVDDANVSATTAELCMIAG
ncbi:hypothetical protein GCM10009619_18320 [Williamsia maris]